MSYLQTLRSRLEGIAGENSGLDAKIKFDTDEGVIFLDATQVPNVFSEEDAEADCTFEISAKNAIKMLDKDLNPMMAFMLGKLKIKGDKELAMKIAQRFG